MAVGNWLSCLTCNGVLVLEWTAAHNRGGTTEVDTFQGSYETYKNVSKAAGGVIVAELDGGSAEPKSATRLGYRTNRLRKKFLLVGRKC